MHGFRRNLYPRLFRFNRKRHRQLPTFEVKPAAAPSCTHSTGYTGKSAVAFRVRKEGLAFIVLPAPAPRVGPLIHQKTGPVFNRPKERIWN